MEASADAVLRLVDAVGTAADRFAEVEDRMLADTGFTGARMRVAAVLAAPGTARTVPQVARSLGLSRQAVQRLADDLAARGLGAWIDNPDHCRARLFQLTASGRAAYGQALQRKALWAQSMSEGLTPAWLAVATELLGLMTRRSEPKTR
ncbi:MarR family transcriptional regulator [Phenylobacterium sp.]|uniref:MarR family winged helix-turn-helix transcriptional regulator n=1 Tax=Phenylobacterium sp. TaxID=1871053 RepID=UPI00289B2778|nr:MarR family transcriptional regulator [Phenylobacterium sp.]